MRELPNFLRQRLMAAARPRASPAAIRRSPARRRRAAAAPVQERAVPAAMVGEQKSRAPRNARLSPPSDEDAPPNSHLDGVHGQLVIRTSLMQGGVLPPHATGVIKTQRQGRRLSCAPMIDARSVQKMIRF